MTESSGGDKVIGVLLAGGLAKRMGGGDKCMRTLAGRPLLEHLIANARYIRAFWHGEPNVTTTLWHRPCGPGITKVFFKCCNHRVALRLQHRIEIVPVRIEVVFQITLDSDRCELVGTTADLEAQCAPHEFRRCSEITQA